MSSTPSRAMALSTSPHEPWTIEALMLSLRGEPRQWRTPFVVDLVYCAVLTFTLTLNVGLCCALFALLLTSLGIFESFHHAAPPVLQQGFLSVAAAAGCLLLMALAINAQQLLRCLWTLRRQPQEHDLASLSLNLLACAVPVIHPDASVPSQSTQRDAVWHFPLRTGGTLTLQHHGTVGASLWGWLQPSSLDAITVILHVPAPIPRWRTLTKTTIAGRVLDHQLDINDHHTSLSLTFSRRHGLWTDARVRAFAQQLCALLSMLPPPTYTPHLRPAHLTLPEQPHTHHTPLPTTPVQTCLQPPIPTLRNLREPLPLLQLHRYAVADLLFAFVFSSVLIGVAALTWLAQPGLMASTLVLVSVSAALALQRRRVERFDELPHALRALLAPTLNPATLAFDPTAHNLSYTRHDTPTRHLRLDTPFVLHLTRAPRGSAHHRAALQQAPTTLDDTLLVGFELRPRQTSPYTPLVAAIRFNLLVVADPSLETLARFEQHAPLLPSQVFADWVAPVLTHYASVHAVIVPFETAHAGQRHL